MKSLTIENLTEDELAQAVRYFKAVMPNAKLPDTKRGKRAARASVFSRLGAMIEQRQNDAGIDVDTIEILIPKGMDGESLRAFIRTSQPDSKGRVDIIEIASDCGGSGDKYQSQNYAGYDKV